MLQRRGDCIRLIEEGNKLRELDTGFRRATQGKLGIKNSGFIVIGEEGEGNEILRFQPGERMWLSYESLKRAILLLTV